MKTSAPTHQLRRLLPTILLFCINVLSCPTVTTAFSPPTLGIGALVFPIRGLKIYGISQDFGNFQKSTALQDASDFFVDAFWTAKVGGGARTLTNSQRRSLEQSQYAEFNKRYGGGSRKSEMLVARNTRDEILGCAGVEVESIPQDRLRGPIDTKAPLMSNLAVSRKCRRRGLAEQMVRAVEKYVQEEWDYDECYLYVEERNRAAVKLYQKLGYKKLWRDESAKTLMPTSSGQLVTSNTVIVCMKKKLSEGNFFTRLFQ